MEKIVVHCCCIDNNTENSFFKSLLVLLIRDSFSLGVYSAEYGLLYVDIEFYLKNNNGGSMFIFITRWFILVSLTLYAFLMLFIFIYAKTNADKIKKDDKQKNKKNYCCFISWY